MDFWEVTNYTMEQTMKKINTEMALYMGVVMSFFLSLTGTLTSGHFKIISFILSFIGSTVVSIIIGFLVPMGKVTMGVDRKMKLRPDSMKARCVNSFISDIIYTPIMTLGMVSFAYMMIKKNSDGHADVNFIGMFFKSLAICFAVGYVLIFIFQPLFMKMLFKKHNVPNREQ